MNFVWDAEKAENNFKKHQVSFEEATTVFSDPLSLTVPDPEHSIGEERYVDIGRSNNGRILIVVYSEREGNIRIISCRRATRRERRFYEEAE
ncbi:MAG: BrnT family toxin [candidate division Zixibacteria bacterium]|nr:BrnT family toxin [candidate division Zixibacteria bacterium]